MKIPVKFNVTVRKEERVAYVYHRIEGHWIGVGYVGSKKRPVIRRFLRARGSDGICSYFFLTEPRRGEMVPRVFGFKRVKKVSAEWCRKHFDK